MIAPRACLTERARAWAFEQVGARDAAVSAVAAQLGVAWATIMSLTIEAGTPMVEDPQRLVDVDAIGVDETAYLRATGRHPTWFATGITDLTPGRPARLLDVVKGRSETVLGGWLAARDPDWRARNQHRLAGPLPWLGHRAGHPAARRHPGTGPLPRRQAGPDLRR